MPIDSTACWERGIRSAIRDGEVERARGVWVLVDSGLAYQAPRPAGAGDVPPLRSIQSGGFASVLLVEKQNQVRWNGTRGPQLPGASFGVPEQTPREALDLKGTEVGDIATSLLGSGTFQPHSRVPSGPLGLKRPSSAQQAEGGECAAFYGL